MKSIRSAILLALSTLALASLHAGEYSNDFDSYANGATDLGDGTTLVDGYATPVVEVYSTGSWQALRLTQDQYEGDSGYGQLILPDLDPGVAVTGFTASFDLLLKSEDGSNADGFSLNFGDIDTGTVTDFEDGFARNDGDMLTLSFDTYDNGSGDVFGRVTAYLNDTEIPGGDTGPNADIHIGSTLDGSNYREVIMSWNTTDGFSVSYGGNSIYSNQAIAFNPEAGSIFGLAGRTGGADQDTFIDNTQIVTVPEVGSGLLASLALGATALFSLLRRKGR